MRQFPISRILIGVLVFVLGIPLLARADDSETTIESTPREMPSGKQASRFPFRSEVKHARQDLEEKGIAANLTLINDWSKNLRGGSSSAGSFDRYSLDVSLTLDSNKAFGWAGGTAFARLKSHDGENGGDYVGDAQGFSNIDDAPRTHLYELWLEQKFLSDRLRVKAGKIDANTEFAVVKSAADFLSSPMGYSPTIMGLPTYPEPKLGVNAFVSPMQHYQLSAGVFRTANFGNMLLFEGGRDWSLGERELGGRSSFGWWHLSGPITCLDGDQLSQTQGFYTVVEQSMWNRKRSAGDENLVAFFQFGNADGDVSRFRRHLGSGLVLQGPFAARAHDAIGLGLTSVRFTDNPAAGIDDRTEVAFEGYYKLSIRPWMSLQPDLQYVHSPGGLRSQSDAVVVTPRLAISF